MPEFTEVPGRFIKAILITDVSSGSSHVLCKTCFCTEYEIDETSVSTVTAQPQPDLLVEKFHAITDHGICPRCHERY